MCVPCVWIPLLLLPPLTHACTLTCGLLAEQRSFLLPRRRRHWSPAKPRGWRTCIPFGYVRLRCSALSVKWDAKAKLKESRRRFRQSWTEVGQRWDPKNERVVWWRRDNRETHDTEWEMSLSSPAHQFCNPNWLARCWAHAFAALHAPQRPTQEAKRLVQDDQKFSIFSWVRRVKSLIIACVYLSVFITTDNIIRPSFSH